MVALLRVALPRDAILHHSPNEQRRGGRASQAILQGMGVYPGWADLVILWRGRVLFLELKAPRGVLSVAQERFAEAVVEQGHAWELVRSPEDAIAALREHGFPVLIRLGV